jgi:hypothetical protein
MHASVFVCVCVCVCVGEVFLEKMEEKGSSDSTIMSASQAHLINKYKKVKGKVLKCKFIIYLF